MCDGVNCLLASPDDIIEWCQKLDLLVEDAQLREYLGGNAKELLEQRYTWNIRAKEIIRICK